MSGRETVNFTIKGPILVQQHNEVSGDARKRTGCSIIDLNFQQPYQLGELVFTNYYTAFLSVYIKRASLSKGQLHTKDLNQVTTQKSFIERSSSIDALGSSSMGHSSRNGLDVDEETYTGLRESSRRGSGSSTSSKKQFQVDLNDRPWECSIPIKMLMPWPHFELGSQDVYSILATESFIEWRDVAIMRLVIHQPSTVWKRFCVEDINVFRNLPKRGYSQSDDLSRQKDGWFAMLKGNTKKMLSGQLVEPDEEKSEERDGP